ncbi:putative endonuclease [Brevibacterium sanguinis]|uniref:UPF0102 protein DFO65_101393 n=2 Tax=Brevibacterium TaxID=1696 RepID=A0A366INM9_9MICO|nr:MULTISPECIES: YraN family protein [Brevibacterium]RBP67915.1 putative endonuclease [Brevibacterium sanguinis]RBP74668.1 putative endonuclease [Brevibacterium celere]
MGRSDVNASRGDRQLALGRLGEDLAVAYLEDRGMTIVERNFRCPRGELDIIARDGDTLVVVEVKTRRTLALGSPLEAITVAKLRRIRLLTALWLSRQSEFFSSVRIDGLGIVTQPRPQYFYAPALQDAS